jgi:dienelactone hydrolase
MPGSCPTTGCFPCAGCWCQPTWDGGSACANQPKKCNSTTGNSCPSIAGCPHGELQRQLDVVFGAAVNTRNGETDELRLNVYQPPASDTRTLRPAAVCMTGGGFNTGDRNKGETNTWAKHLASRGFVAVTIDYRLERQKTNGQNVSAFAGINRDAAYDAKAAVRWLVKHSTEYRVSADHIVAFGSSAGGMMVAWLTGVRSDGEGTSGNPGFPSNITAGISLSGFLLPTEDSEVKGGQTPYLDFHGTADTTVLLAYAEATHAEFVAKKNPAALITIAGKGHVPWDSMEQRSEDFFGFLTTYARLGELQCPKKA